MTDYLSRQPYLDLLKSIIANQCGNPSGYSFAIDGEWGCGKTWILTELEKQLAEDSENKYLIFHYNAWENDFYDEPLVAILSVMIEKLEEFCKSEEVINGINKKLAATSLKILKNLVISIVNATVQNKIAVDFKDVVEDFQKIGDEKSDLKSLKKEVDSFFTLKSGIKEIRNQLTELSGEHKILLIVDELDRCLPEYAIKVLERLHHVCNGIPIIQIITINKKILASNIAKVFGKDYQTEDHPDILINLFCESYLQKFIDIIIPLPNGKIDRSLDVLQGIEKGFTPCIRPNNIGQELIKLDDVFLTTFISSLMDGIEKRLQEKIFNQVTLCHKLTIQTDIKYNNEQMSYAILIYEIISCICRYVYHSNKTCCVTTLDDVYTLDFYTGIDISVIPETTEYVKFQNNIHEFLTYPINYFEDNEGRHRYAFEIHDTKSFLLAFFTKQEVQSYDPLQNGLWRWIEEDKIFLNKYDEILNMLCSNI